MYARLYDLGEAPSFEERVRLLSTTHFGLASPVLNLTRERTALALSEKMMGKEDTALYCGALCKVGGWQRAGGMAVVPL